MAQLFNENSLCDDVLASIPFNKSSLSPMRKDYELEDDLIEPFKPNYDNSKIGSYGQPTELLWNPIDQMDSPIGRQHAVLPATKKLKVGHNTALNFSVEYIHPSTQSDTSHHSSDKNNSKISSGQTSFASKNEETYSNPTSHYDQSLCSDQHNLTSQSEQSLTKRKRGMKQNTKDEQKKKEIAKPVKNTKKKTKKENTVSSIESNLDGSRDIDSLYGLTNKKKEYLQEAILDKNGVFTYMEDPLEYKRARKRMQNRESAVRSRMRKRYYQDDLEDKISQLEKIQKQLHEDNTGLAAQNALLKKQLAYFEDVFAKSSLIGYDPMGNSINRNDLEEFQKNLLRKINARFHHEREQESPLYHDDSLELIPGSSHMQRNAGRLDDIDEISTTSQENQLNSLRLIRSRSNSSSFSNTGYLFLAVVFCMMCCSSLLSYPTGIFKQVVSSSFSSQMKGSQDTSFAPSRKLLFKDEKKSKLTSQNLAGPLEEDAEMTPEDVVQKPEGPMEFVRLIMSGQFNYLTYFILSTTCFFFWLTPNCHKLQRFFTSKSQTTYVSSSSRRVSSRNSNVTQRQVTTRSSSKKQKETLL